MSLSLRVSEIFFSLAGEGGRQGCPSIFIRLQGCSAKHACYASGVVCDTEFESGKEITLEELLDRIEALSMQCRWIVWTGGEPADQLTHEVVAFFKTRTYMQAIETSGVKPICCPDEFDYIVVSPKVAEHVLAKNFIEPVHELRYVRHAGQEIPQPSIKAKMYFLSPHFNGQAYDEASVKHCIKLCLENPKWRLSIQIHKMLQIL